jgi:hypothetical protein
MQCPLWSRWLVSYRGVYDVRRVVSGDQATAAGGPNLAASRKNPLASDGYPTRRPQPRMCALLVSTPATLGSARQPAMR